MEFRRVLFRSFTTISQFRLELRAAFAEQVQQVLELCVAAGLVKLGHVALDGTKMKANDAMNAQLATPRGRALYARRRSTVEPRFGQIRACRGFHHFSLRGLFKGRCEWLLVCATHNLLKLWRATAAPRF